MTLNLSPYPQCAKRLHFQRVSLDDFLNAWLPEAVIWIEDEQDDRSANTKLAENGRATA